MLRLLIENILDREEMTMTEWIECRISDIGTVVGGATPSTKKLKTILVEKLLGLHQRIYLYLVVDILNVEREI